MRGNGPPLPYLRPCMKVIILYLNFLYFQKILFILFQENSCLKNRRMSDNLLQLHPFFNVRSNGQLGRKRGRHVSYICPVQERPYFGGIFCLRQRLDIFQITRRLYPSYFASSTTGNGHRTVMGIWNPSGQPSRFLPIPSFFILLLTACIADEIGGKRES